MPQKRILFFLPAINAMTENPQQHTKATAGLPSAPAGIDKLLFDQGIDADRLSISFLGRRIISGQFPSYPWFRGLIIGFVFLLAFQTALNYWAIPELWRALGFLTIGLMLLISTCQALVDATLWAAAKRNWSHYVAGTVSEIISTLPELVVISCIALISPASAFITVLITVYSNTLLFSFYSFFLPKNHHNKFVMPPPITEAGTQVLIAGGALTITLGLGMLLFSLSDGDKQSFSPPDLVFISLIFLSVFAIYLIKLMRNSADEEATVSASLHLNKDEEAQRKELVYEYVPKKSWLMIGVTFLAGIAGAFYGGESISEFATFALNDLQLNPILSAIIFALLAGMSEIIMLHTAHQQKEYGIALANALGGITQVMFLIFPFTLLAIAYMQLYTPEASNLAPLEFNITNTLLVLLLFPTFYTLATLIEEDHTLDILDTTVMLAMISLLIALLAVYGS